MGLAACSFLVSDFLWGTERNGFWGTDLFSERNGTDFFGTVVFSERNGTERNGTSLINDLLGERLKKVDFGPNLKIRDVG